MANPPASFTSSVSLISVPLPAIFVAIVTADALPASDTTSASFWCIFAFNTLCFIPLLRRIVLSNSEISTEVVPTNIGLPLLVSSAISSITALYFSRLVLKTRSFLSSLCIERLVGIATTSSLYISQNSPASVSAVPVIPDILLYILK